MPRVAIIGSGLIGRAWAMVFARAGWDAAMYDAVDGVADKALGLVAEGLDELAKHGLVDDPRAAASRIRAAKSLADALAQCAKGFGFTERHGEARVHQPHTEWHGDLFEVRCERRDTLRARKISRGKLAQRFRFRIDGNHMPAAAQQLDDVATVAAAEIDRQRLGRRRAEVVERRHQRAARRPVTQLLVVGRPSCGTIGCLRHCVRCDRIAPTIIVSRPGRN